MTSSWPFGKPNQNHESYGGDQQYYEDEALRFKHYAENKLTPTGRLKKGTTSQVFLDLIKRATDKINNLIEHYPTNADIYRRWLDEVKEIAAKVK